MNIISKTYSDLEINYHTFVLYWLDAEVNNTEHNKNVQKQLRTIVKHLRIFDDVNQCQSSIETFNRQERLILIVSGRFGQMIVPKIHDLPQISSIYIYCQDKTFHEQWAQEFFKIREVIIELNYLINEIQLIHRIHLKYSLPISYNIYSDIHDQHTSTYMLNQNFIQSLILINNLLRLESTNDIDRQEFLSFCKKEYKNNKFQLNLIEEFKENYTSDKVLWWYTRESFFFRILDKILRLTTKYFEQFLFSRLFIQNIFQQLNKYQYSTNIQVYFGQIMRTSEIEYLRNPQSKYLAINTFWLTNINQEKIRLRLNDIKKEQEEHMVLFSINADPMNVHRKPFADISKCCHFNEQGEILFMIGSIFRLIGVDKIENMFCVRLEYCEDNEEFYQSLQIYNDNIYGNDKINLQNFGDILYRMEQYDLAERIYQKLLNKLSSNDPICSDIYLSMGMVAKNKEEYNLSMKYYEKALKSKQRTNKNDSLRIGMIHACIGEIHRLQGNDQDALKCFEKAVELYTKEHAEFHQHMADFYDNIASIYRRSKQYEEALCYSRKALDIDEKQSSGNSLGAAKSHNNIATIYCFLHQYDLALAHYQHSLAIKLQVSPISHLSIANNYGNVAHVYKIIGDWEKALSYYKKAAVIYEQILPAHHFDLIKTNNEIELIVQKLT